MKSGCILLNIIEFHFYALICYIRVLRVKVKYSLIKIWGELLWKKVQITKNSSIVDGGNEDKSLKIKK